MCVCVCRLRRLYRLAMSGVRLQRVKNWAKEVDMSIFKELIIP